MARTLATTAASTAYIGLLKDIAVAANEAATPQNALEAALRSVCYTTGWRFLATEMPRVPGRRLELAALYRDGREFQSRSRYGRCATSSSGVSMLSLFPGGHT